MALHLGNDDLARQRFIRLLEYVRGVEDKSAAGLYLEGMAAAGGTHPPERVAKLLGAAQAQLVANRRVGSPEIGLKIDYLCQSARDQLGPARFEALHAAGQALSFEQALAYALEQGRG
jgi:hypothetical protein